MVILTAYGLQECKSKAALIGSPCLAIVVILFPSLYFQLLMLVPSDTSAYQAGKQGEKKFSSLEIDTMGASQEDELPLNPADGYLDLLKQKSILDHVWSGFKFTCLFLSLVCTMTFFSAPSLSIQSGEKTSLVGTKVLNNFINSHFFRWFLTVSKHLQHPLDPKCRHAKSQVGDPNAEK